MVFMFVELLYNVVALRGVDVVAVVLLVLHVISTLTKRSTIVN